MTSTSDVSPVDGKEEARRSPERLAVGRVVRPHGIRGALLVAAYSEVIWSLKPSSKITLGEDRRPWAVRSIRPHGGRYLLTLDGCEDRTSAEALRGQELYVSFADAEPLPEGVYYYWQIIGLSVMSDVGEPLGEVVEIIETGANDVYVVRDRDGREVLLPAIESVVLEVNLEKGSMVVHLLPGLRPET